MRVKPAKMIRNQRGGSLIEFAILLPLLVLIVFGILEGGLVLYDQQVITNASREGARFGIVSRSPRYNQSEIETVVRNYCLNHLITFGSWIQPQVTSDPSDTALFGQDLTVVVQWRYEFLVLPDFLGGPLTATTVMKYE